MANLVVVAIPSEDSPVWKISSEKIPHMTILFLGEMPVRNFADIARFVQHASERSLTRFDMEVDRRGELGPDKADVLFFSKNKWSGYSSVAEFRSYLLQDSNIQMAYQSVEQYSEWLPHLTLGYPETPAKPDNREYPGISYVYFDKIALWFNDYEGFDYPLKGYDWDLEVAMSSAKNERGRKETEKVLQHYGVKGMKWGVRRERRQAAKAAKKIQKQRQAEVNRKKRLAEIDNEVRRLVKDPREVEKLKITLHNESLPIAQAKLHAINSKSEYNKPETDFTNDKDPIVQKYRKEVQRSYISSLNEWSASQLQYPGVAIKVEAAVGPDVGFGPDTFNIRVVDKEAKHADDPMIMTIRMIMDAQGKISGFEMINNSINQSSLFIEDFLEHYGVKGMKWGVRRKRTPTTKVTVSQKKGGAKLKARGGEGRPANVDAVRAKAIDQVIKKSGYQALSNDDLRSYNERLNLEVNARKLRSQNVSTGQRFVQELLGVSSDVAMQEAKSRASTRKVKNNFSTSSPSTSTALVRRG